VIGHPREYLYRSSSRVPEHADDGSGLGYLGSRRPTATRGSALGGVPEDAADCGGFGIATVGTAVDWVTDDTGAGVAAGEAEAIADGEAHDVTLSSTAAARIALRTE